MFKFLSLFNIINYRNKQIIIDTQSTDAVKGILEENNLTRLFFSPQNIEAIQNSIRYYVYKLSDGQIISNQSPDELFIVMRSTYLQYSQNISTNDVLAEIKYLNKMVINYCVEKIVSELVSYNLYLEDINKLPIPNNRPRDTSSDWRDYTYDMTNII